jgi:hypothetical protein
MARQPIAQRVQLAIAYNAIEKAQCRCIASIARSVKKHFQAVFKH